jgi:AbrB family looped-hinge helix DNA binding protein
METRAKIGEGGRLVIPAEVRRRLAVDVGDEVVLRLVGDVLEVMTPRAALARARALIRAHVPPGKSLAAELIADRRTEAKRD